MNSGKKKKKTKLQLNLKNILIITGIIIIVGIISIIGIFTVAAASLPEWDPSHLSGDKTTFVYDAQGEVATLLHSGQNRTEVGLNKIPEDLLNAVVAIEDANFYEHHGVDIRRIMVTAVRNVLSGDLTAQGASTITQQLARNAFLSIEKKWERKIKEAVLAVKLEVKYSKDEILNMYLNIIPFGAGNYGVQAAANTYFGKNVEDLNLAECSLLAGLPQSPEGYNPFKHLDRAKARQRQVLNAMVECGYIDQHTADQAYQTELDFDHNKSSNNYEYGYFTDAVIEEALDIIKNLQIYDDPEDALYRSGLKIYTTLDTELQEYAQEVFANPDNLPKQTNEYGDKVQSAMVLIDIHNGEIKAVMGGRIHEQQRGFNRATSAYRQPGSAIKPISVYSPALEDGYMPFFVLDDSPISYKIEGSTEIWKPTNYDGSYRGLITMRTAVQWSINTYAIQLLEQIGIRRSFDFAESMGLDLVDTPGHNDLGLSPLALGGLTRGVTPVQMAGAYAAIANGGVYIEPHFITRIVSDKGIELYNFEPVYKRVMSEQSAWLMNNMLQSVVNYGTGTRAKVPNVITAGKTGTTEEYNDSWFCGFTPNYAAAVWMGFDKKTTMRNYPPEYPSETAYGGNFPARIFKSVMTEAHKNTSTSAFLMPKGIVKVAVCSLSGKLPSNICPEDKIISEYCNKNAIPSEICDRHELVNICAESGKLANEFCPNPEVKIMVKTAPGSYTPNKIPEEKCEIHSAPSAPDLNVIIDKPKEIIDNIFSKGKNKKNHQDS